MSDGSRVASVPITASAISAVLNCLFGRESKSSDSTNLGLFSKSDTASSDSISSSESSFSENSQSDWSMRKCFEAVLPFPGENAHLKRKPVMFGAKLMDAWLSAMKLFLLFCFFVFYVM